MHIHTRDLRAPGQKPDAGLGLDLGSPLLRGLGALWLFQEGAGVRANDLGRKGIRATLTDDRMWSGGAALKFSGSNYGSFSDNPAVFAGNEFSVFASIIPTAFGAGHDDATIFSKGSAPYTVYLTVGGSKVNLFTEGNASWLDGSASVAANMRSVVGATKDSSGRKTWLNGARDTSDGVTSALSWSSLGGRLGHRQDDFHPNDQFKGIIEWIGYWTRGLSAAEIALLTADPHAIIVPTLFRRTYSLPGGTVRFRRTIFDRAGARGFMKD